MSSTFAHENFSSVQYLSFPFYHNCIDAVIMHNYDISYLLILFPLTKDIYEPNKL